MLPFVRIRELFRKGCNILFGTKIRGRDIPRYFCLFNFESKRFFISKRRIVEFFFNIEVINIFCTHDNFIRDSLLLSFFRTIINDTKTNVRIFFRDSKVIYFEIQLNIFIYQRDWDISIRIGFHLKNTCTTKYIIFTTCQNE